MWARLKTRDLWGNRMRESGKRSGGLKIGLTGGIACGKSEVGRILRKLGVAVIDADELAHEVMRPRTVLCRRIRAWFGRDIVKASGEIDRGRLGRIVFSDARARKALNALVHPAVINLWKKRVREVLKRKSQVVVIVPLLFEVGEEKSWDAVVCVAASRDVVLKRLRDRKLSRADSLRRIRAQAPLSSKIRKSDCVIWNNGTIRELEKTTRKIWKHLLKKESKHHG